MSFAGYRSESSNRISWHLFLLIITMGILVLFLFLVPQATGGELKRDIVMMVDNSGSMKKNDPEFLAGEALKTFISDSDYATRLALITFDQNVKLVLPFTPLTEASRPSLVTAVQQIDYTGSLTNSPAALERAIYEFALHGRDDADKSIIFITDGIVDTGNKIRDKQQEDWMLEELAVLAEKLNVRIYGIAFAEAANYQLIQKLTSKTRGDYFRVLYAEDLPRVFARLEETYRPVKTPSIQEYQQTKSVADEQTPEEVRSEVQTSKTAPSSEERKSPEVSPQPVDDAERLNSLSGADSLRFDSILQMSLKKAQRLYLGNEYSFWAAGLFALAVVGFIFIWRKTRSNRLDDSLISNEQLNALLIDINNETSHRHHPLSKTVTKIGRVNPTKSSGDFYYLLIDKPTIGREHALIEYKKGSYWLIDLDSTNGTFVNGKRVRDKARLKNGDQIRFYDTEFIFSVPELNKFDKTLSITAFGSQSQDDTNDSDFLFGDKLDNESSAKLPSISAVRTRKSHFNREQQKRVQSVSHLNTAGEGVGHTELKADTGIFKRNVSGEFREVATRSIANRIHSKPSAETVSQMKSYVQSKGGTEQLNDDTRQHFIGDIKAHTRQTKREDTRKVKTLSDNQTMGTGTDSLNKDFPEHTITKLSSASTRDLERFKHSDTLEIPTLSPSATMKDTTVDNKEFVSKEEKAPFAYSQVSAGKADEQVDETEQSDTEEIPQGDFDSIFNSKQDKTEAQRRTEKEQDA